MKQASQLEMETMSEIIIIAEAKIVTSTTNNKSKWARDSWHQGNHEGTRSCGMPITGTTELLSTAENTKGQNNNTSRGLYQ